MRKIVKNSIAKKLTWRVSVILVVAFMLLLGGAFYSLDRMVRLDAERYAKSLVTIYSDMALYDSKIHNRPIDESFGDRFSFFGEYICTWYRVNYVFAYVPDVENNTITYLSVVQRDKSKKMARNRRAAGEVESYQLLPHELDVWNGKSVFAVEGMGLFESVLGVTLAVTDQYGNRSMVGVSISIDEFIEGMMHGFMVVVLFIFAIIVVVAVFLYLFMKRMVSSPARDISAKMAGYVSEGVRSALKLEPSGGDDEFAMIAQSFNQMTEEIDKYIDRIALLDQDKKRQQAELDIASAIQMGILLPQVAMVGNCDIEAMMKPANSVGGDLYDYLQINPNKSMIVVADVSGKGIPSALLMAVILVLIHQLGELGYTPANILRSINNMLSKNNPKFMFATAFVAIYDATSGKLTYANAGHNPPYLIHDTLIPLDQSTGTPIGLFPDETYSDIEVDISAGDSVFLYTDGVTEAVNPAGDFFDTKRLEQVLVETHRSGNHNFVESVKTSLQSFTAGAYQSDDITMLNLYVSKKRCLQLDYDAGQLSVIRNLLQSYNFPKQLFLDLCVMVEECFVNICSYAFDGEPPEGEKILFSIECSNRVVMRFSDGGKPFDPRCNIPNTEEYDIDNTIGGLGRFIAFAMADAVDYEYTDGRNILTITKSIQN